MIYMFGKNLEIMNDRNDLLKTDLADSALKFEDKTIEAFEREKQERRNFYLNLFKEVDELPNTLEVGYFKMKGFNIDKKLKQINGSFVEIGGPTVQEFNLINTKELPKKLITSNIRTHKNIDKPDFFADAKNMPLENNSVGALFSKNISIDSSEYKDLAKEAWRIIEPGGVFIFEGGRKDIFKSAKETGFNVVQHSVQTGKNDLYCNFIFEKPQKYQEENQ